MTEPDQNNQNPPGTSNTNALNEPVSTPNEADLNIKIDIDRFYSTPINKLIVDFKERCVNKIKELDEFCLDTQYLQAELFTSKYENDDVQKD